MGRRDTAGIGTGAPSVRHCYTGATFHMLLSPTAAGERLVQGPPTPSRGSVCLTFLRVEAPS